MPRASTRWATALPACVSRCAIRSCAPRLVRDLAVSLGGGYYVSDWTRNHANFFRSIEITKSMLFVILLLVVAVAAFNIVAALVMVVKEKRSDIAILRTLGAAPRNVLAMFALQGAFIGSPAPLPGRRWGCYCRPISRRWCTHSSICWARIFSTPGVLHERSAGLCRMGRRAAHLCAWPSRCAPWRRCIRPGAPRGTQPAEALRHD